MSTKPKHLDALLNSSKEVVAWKIVAAILATISLATTYGLVQVANNAPVTLVPHELASSKGPIKVLGGSNPGAEYLQMLSAADLNLILNWTPLTIQNQYARFLNRLSPELFASENVRLDDDANQFIKQATSQSFFPTQKAQIKPDSNEITVEGILKRWEGEKEVFNEKVTYTLIYKRIGGTMYVNSIQIK